MSRISTAALLFVIFTFCLRLQGEQPRDVVKPIPLDKAWGYDIPGTRDVEELQPKPDSKWTVDEVFRRSDTFKILKVLHERPKVGDKAGQAFVVRGVGKTALENAEAVFGKRTPRATSLPLDAELSLVFYSHMCGRYVRIKSVESIGNVIKLKYQFVGHATTNMSTHFALIPLGKLTSGKYQVKIEQLEPIDDRGGPAKPIPDPEQLVCDSCSFTIQGD